MPRVALRLNLDVQTRNTLDKFVASPSTPQSLVLRSRIVLAAADGSNNQQIAAALKIPPITVGKWRRSFAMDGVEGLRDAPRSGRPPKHDAQTRNKLQTRVCQQPEDQSRWTVRTLAAEVGPEWQLKKCVEIVSQGNPAIERRPGRQIRRLISN